MCARESLQLSSSGIDWSAGRLQTHLAQELIRLDLKQTNDAVTHVRPKLGSDEVIDLVQVEAVDVCSRDGLSGRPAKQLKVRLDTKWGDRWC